MKVKIDTPIDELVRHVMQKANVDDKLIDVVTQDIIDGRENGVKYTENDEPISHTDYAMVWGYGGLRHRKGDKPAYIDMDGNTIWYMNGTIHRDVDLPSVVNSDGSIIWHRNGARHRDNNQVGGIFANGAKVWYKDGTIHRTDGAAIIQPNVRDQFFIEGRQMSFSEWLRNTEDELSEDKIIELSLTYS